MIFCSADRGWSLWILYLKGLLSEILIIFLLLLLPKWQQGSEIKKKKSWWLCHVAWRNLYLSSLISVTLHFRAFLLRMWWNGSVTVRTPSLWPPQCRAGLQCTFVSFCFFFYCYLHEPERENSTEFTLLVAFTYWWLFNFNDKTVKSALKCLPRPVVERLKSPSKEIETPAHF